MKGFIDELGMDRPACAKCKHRGKMTVEVPCYNCISAVDLALHKPNYQTEFAAFEPIAISDSTKEGEQCLN